MSASKRKRSAEFKGKLKKRSNDRYVLFGPGERPYQLTPRKSHLTIDGTIYSKKKLKYQIKNAMLLIDPSIRCRILIFPFGVQNHRIALFYSPPFVDKEEVARNLSERCQLLPQVIVSLLEFPYTKNGLIDDHQLLNSQQCTNLLTASNELLQDQLKLGNIRNEMLIVQKTNKRHDFTVGIPKMNILVKAHSNQLSIEDKFIEVLEKKAENILHTDYVQILQERLFSESEENTGKRNFQLQLSSPKSENFRNQFHQNYPNEKKHSTWLVMKKTKPHHYQVTYRGKEMSPLQAFAICLTKFA